jgi:D-3-phosphoglycerate dehydrogenase / 2-oxoglutarate reductase
MSKKVLLATEKPFSATARDEVVGILKKANYGVVLLESYKNKNELLQAVADVDAMIVRSDIIDKEVLKAASKLQLVVRAGAGYDNIDGGNARERRVDVMNTPGQNSNAVAELAFGLMLYMARGKFDGKTGSELRGKNLGIHAFGAVGRQIAAIGKGFGMIVRAYDPFVDRTLIAQSGVEPIGTVEDLYRVSDYLSLNAPATPETKKSVGAKLLGLLPQSACLVNTARKELLNEPDLIEVLEKRSDLRYVSDIEPDSATLAVMKEKFANRVYFTPKKMGAQTNEAKVNAGLAAARQIVGYFERGEKKYVVNA